LTDGNGVAAAQNPRFILTAARLPHVKDRRKELRPNTRLQLLSVSGGLTGLSAADLERALTLLYVAQPLRWQTFMDEAKLVIDAAGAYDSGFAETVQPLDG
jgi:hypothetical protein